MRMLEEEVMRVLSVILILFFVPLTLHGAGVTIVTHGASWYHENITWLSGMGHSIRDKLPTDRNNVKPIPPQDPSSLSRCFW